MWIYNFKFVYRLALGGIKESYRAYQRWAANHPEKLMPGLDYTPQQMFWISAGQVWCSVYREEGKTFQQQQLFYSHHKFALKFKTLTRCWAILTERIAFDTKLLR